MGIFSSNYQRQNGEFAAIVPSKNGLCIAASRIDSKGQAILSACEYIAWNSTLAVKNLVGQKVRQYKLNKHPFATTLELGDYTLLSVEAPDVPPGELRSAVRWQVKDLIDFHVDDAVLDVFDAPASGAHGQMRNLYVVISRKAVVEQHIKPFHDVAANLNTIDIPELVLRNITARLPEDENGLLFVYLSAERGLLIITRQSTLYLARPLGFGFNDLSKIIEQQNELATSPAFDRLILEIQRSLDYYDRYFMQAPIGNIVVSPVQVELPNFIQSVESSLGIRSRWLDLNEVITSETELNAEIQQQCLLAVGAALRKEKRTL